jgi:hypothetical protein
MISLKEIDRVRLLAHHDVRELADNVLVVCVGQTGMKGERETCVTPAYRCSRAQHAMRTEASQRQKSHAIREQRE